MQSIDVNLSSMGDYRLIGRTIVYTEPFLCNVEVFLCIPVGFPRNTDQATLMDVLMSRFGGRFCGVKTMVRSDAPDRDEIAETARSAAR